MYIFCLVGGDFIFSFITIIIDVKYYKGIRALHFIINLLLFTPLLISVVVLLLIKRRKQCIIGGFLYLIVGILVWLSRIIYFIYLVVSGNLQNDYTENYANYIYFISFLLSILTIFFRIGSCYLIKKMYADVCTYEEFLHEKEQADFLQSLGTKGENDERLYEDEEITVESLGQNNKNPFITGRKKKGEDDEEEIHFEATL